MRHPRVTVAQLAELCGAQRSSLSIPARLRALLGQVTRCRSSFSHGVWAFPCAVWACNGLLAFFLFAALSGHTLDVPLPREAAGSPHGQSVPSLDFFWEQRKDPSSSSCLCTGSACSAGQTSSKRHAVCMLSTALKIPCALPTYSTCLYPGTRQPLSLLLPP